MISTICDKDPIYDIFDYDVILIGTSIKNSLNNGFQHKIAKSFPFVKKSNNETRYDDRDKLGTVRVVTDKTVPSIIFLLCYITKGHYRNTDCLDYEALEKCLKIVNRHFKDKRILTTVLGHSSFEGGGDKDRIIGMMETLLSDCESVTVYDYEQEDYRREESGKYWKMVNDWNEGRISREEYVRLKEVYNKERKYGVYGKV